MDYTLNIGSVVVPTNLVLNVIILMVVFKLLGDRFSKYVYRNI